MKQIFKEKELNIFKSAGIVEKEVFMCKFLAKLLNNNKYLKLFLKLLKEKESNTENTLLNFDIENFNLAYKNISTEVYTKNDKRRIDIVIDIHRKLWLPIEVKINSKERETQCQDYLIKAQNKEGYELNGNAKICYITKHDEPNSIKNKNDVICLLWKDIAEAFRQCKNGSVAQYCEAIDYFYKESKNNKPLLNPVWKNIQKTFSEKEFFYTKNAWNIYYKKEQNNHYININIDNYPIVKFGIVNKKKNDFINWNKFSFSKDFDWQSYTCYKEIDITKITNVEAFETECKNWFKANGIKIN